MGHTRIAVRLTPKARADEIVGAGEGVLSVRVRAPAVEGRANAALCRVLAKRLHIAAGRVTIVKGASSRRKMVQIEGIDADQLRSALSLPDL